MSMLGSVRQLTRPPSVRVLPRIPLEMRVQQRGFFLFLFLPALANDKRGE